jgi:hypothetical protein
MEGVGRGFDEGLKQHGGLRTWNSVKRVLMKDQDTNLPLRGGGR